MVTDGEKSKKPQSPSTDDKVHWSPPKDTPASWLPDKYPEKGVRVMKVEEAYPDGEVVLPDLENADLQKIHLTSRKMPADKLENPTPTSAP